MDKDIINNLYSDARLSDCTLDFLETIKFKKFELENNERFELISFVNSNYNVLKNIFKAKYETGFSKKYKLNNDYDKNYLDDLNDKRKSVRKYSDIPLSLDQLSFFLKRFYCTIGTESYNLNEGNLIRDKRNIASGGGIYPTEIFIYNQKIKEIPCGIYRYDVFNFELELIRESTPEDKSTFYNILMTDENRKSVIDYRNSSIFLIFTTIINKQSFKYQDFAIPLSLIEIGQFIHSAYLSCASLNIGCCPFGSIINDDMNEFLELRNPLHYPIICMSLGNNIE